MTSQVNYKNMSDQNCLRAERFSLGPKRTRCAKKIGPIKKKLQKRVRSQKYLLYNQQSCLDVFKANYVVQYTNVDYCEDMSASYYWNYRWAPPN